MCQNETFVLAADLFKKKKKKKITACVVGSDDKQMFCSESDVYIICILDWCFDIFIQLHDSRGEFGGSPYVYHRGTISALILLECHPLIC